MDWLGQTQEENQGTEAETAEQVKAEQETKKQQWCCEPHSCMSNQSKKSRRPREYFDPIASKVQETISILQKG